MLWLQLHLCKRKGTLVVVSHDQEFLNAVCNNIIHVHDRKLLSDSIEDSDGFYMPSHPAR